MTQKKFELASQQFAAAIELNPLDPMPYANMGEALANLGRFPEAASYFRKAAERRPGNAMDHYNLGRALTISAKFDEAIVAYEKALALQPAWPEAHFDTGIALVNRRRWHQAVSHYEKALDLRPVYPEALNNLSWLLATCPDAGIRNGKRAVTLANKACELTREKIPGMLGTLDAAYAEAGQLDEAINAAMRTQELANVLGQKEIADAAMHRLVLYREGKPFREQ